MEYVLIYTLAQVDAARIPLQQAVSPNLETNVLFEVFVIMPKLGISQGSMGPKVRSGL